MNCYAVIDTNVIVSALLSRYPDAATVQVFDRMLDGRIVPLFSDEIMAEYSLVLGRKKFKFEPALVEHILHEIKTSGILVNPIDTDVVLPDIKDLPFYRVVLSRKDDAYLVTGNLKHFPNEPFIVTARELLDILGD